MTTEELLKKWIEENGVPEICNYCICDSDCKHNVVCYGGEPIFPPCADGDIEELLDTDAILADIESEAAI